MPEVPIEALHTSGQVKGKAIVEEDVFLRRRASCTQEDAGEA